MWFGGENVSLTMEFKWTNNKVAVSKTKFMMVSLKYYNENKYVKICIYNFEIVKHILVQF